MVEFALVLPIVLLLLFGMLQFALVLNARQTVAYAAQAAANGYAQTLERARGDAEARTAGAQLRPEMSRAGRVSYSLIRAGNESAITSDGTGAFGDLVVARVTYGFPSPVRAGIGAFRFPDTITLTSEAVARIEAPATGTASQGSTLAAGPTPTPTAPPSSTSSPASTTMPAPGVAYCYAYTGSTVNVPGWSGILLIDGRAPTNGQRFEPESQHDVRVQSYPAAGGGVGATWSTGTMFAPWVGPSGVSEVSTVRFGSVGTAQLRFIGIPGRC